MTKSRHIWSNLAIHPGESLAEEMQFRGISVDELAELTDQPPSLIHAIIRGEKPITSPFATALDSLLEIPTQFWINLQTKYEKTLAHNEIVAREGTDHACDLGEECPVRQTYHDDEDDEDEFTPDEQPSRANILMDEGE